MASPVSHLHQEAQFAFVGDHISMLCTQFLASSYRDDHPSNAVVTLPPGPRSMKNTLQSKHLPLLEPHLVAGKIRNYKDTLKAIHTQAVSNTISSLDPNPVLGATPPPIFSYLQRTTLAIDVREDMC